MGTTLRVILALAIWLIYSLFAYHGCIKPTCCGTPAEEEAMDQPFDVQQLGPVISNWSTPALETNVGYGEWRGELVETFGQNEDQYLEITGLYYEGEPKPEGFANMGFARAEAVKELLAPDIPAERIHTRARAVFDEPDSIQVRPFTALGDVKWIETETQRDESVNVIDDESGRVDRVVFLFALNATIQDDNPEIMTELEKMAADIVEKERTVSVVGHADNSGTTDYNYELGLTRANTIKDVLVRLGVPETQIQVDSRGETQPTDTNDTEEGRHNNRRVEVRIID